MIKADSVNKKVWDDVLTTVKAQGSVRLNFVGTVNSDNCIVGCWMLDISVDS